MLYYGEFLTQAGETCRVEITTGRDRSASVEIGGDGGLLKFTDNPLEIECEVNDTFDHLIRRSASIRLLSRGFMADLYSRSLMEGEVVVKTGGEIEFAGFLQPQTYSQPFSEVYDEIELNCIDCISALRYERYGNAGAPGVDYDSLREAAGMKSFGNILREAFSHSFTLYGLPILTWDDSVALLDSEDNPCSPWTEGMIHELLFLGDDEDSVWTLLTVVEEILRYLNLYIRQEGMRLRIFSCDMMQSGALSAWKPVLPSSVQEPVQVETVDISTKIARGAETNISIGEVYNRIELRSTPTEVEKVVESPLDEETLTSPFRNRQLFMTEYIDNLENNPQDAWDRLTWMFDGSLPYYSESSRRDWYLRMHDSLRWRFRVAGATPDDVSAYFASGTHQEKALNLLATHHGAALCSLGNLLYEAKYDDNSLKPSLEMSRTLVVAVNGNGVDSGNEVYPSEASLLAAMPVAEYTGNVSGGAFSPADDEITNYIVFQGKIALTPLLMDCQSKAFYGKRWDEVTWPDTTGMNDTFRKVALSGALGKNPCKDGERAYVCRWWECETPFSTPADKTTAGGFWPFTGDAAQQYQFNYSAVGNGMDLVSKVSVLECMLIIGDKCVVETGTQGQPSDFEWKTFRTREQCATDDEYYAQSFSIGFDPKIGDFLIGQEYDIQNNISFDMGLDVEGMAIPVRKSDKVSGKVTFRILGPVNLEWDDITRRHRTWFRRTKWTTGCIPLMAHVQNICIKDFGVVVATDNGFLGNDGETEITYVSDTDERYLSVKDDLEMKITSALTRDERLELGVKDGGVNLSTPSLRTSGEPVVRAKNKVTGDVGKPEQLYVDARWREWHEPRITLQQTLRHSKKKGRAENIFRHPALEGKCFRVVGSGRNIIEDADKLILKECES